MFAKVLLICIFTAIPAVVYSATYNATVAADGSGNYKTVAEAISHAPGTSRFTIFIKAGTYKEQVTINKKMVTLIGEDETKTIITDALKASDKDKNGNEIGTFATATVFVEADEFEAEKITFQNTAGQTAGQALALRVDGEKVVFKDCRFLGWQDTILVNKGHHYFSNCYIEGHVDFIFGAATAFFDKCHIYSKAKGAITAASTDQSVKYGLVFSHCTIDAASGVDTYLGRPWRGYASVYYVYSSMSSAIDPAGWLEWQGEPGYDKTARYYEYGNTGTGASLSKRVTWSHELTKAEADALTVQAVLGFTPS